MTLSTYRDIGAELSTALGIRLTVISNTVTREFDPCSTPFSMS